MKNLTITNETTKEVLESVEIGDIITDGDTTGKVFQIFKGVNAGQMAYDFYIDGGKFFTEYSFNKRAL